MSKWATPYIAALAEDRNARFRPRGNSMKGKIESGDLVEVAPLKNDPKNGDVVLCQVDGNHYLHIVKAMGPRGFLIGNNKGRINGWTSRANIFGILAAVNPKEE